MKFTSALSAFGLFLSILLSAQNISGYQYVYVPKKFTDFKTNNQYNLNNITAEKLNQKGYTVLRDENEVQNMRSNTQNCIVNTEIRDDSNIFRTKIRLEFTDCTGKMVSSYPMQSMIKEIEPGMQESAVNVLKLVPKSSPQSYSASQVASVKPTVPATGAGNVYLSGTEEYALMENADGSLLLVTTKNNLFAKLHRSSRPGIYHVTMANGSQTVGFLENNRITVEVPQPDSTYRPIEFVRK